MSDDTFTGKMEGALLLLLLWAFTAPGCVFWMDRLGTDSLRYGIRHRAKTARGKARVGRIAAGVEAVCLGHATVGR